ncbi:MAG: CidA/LrgA family protein [Hungatella sp.]|nr:CidA/LrgA family protein [Hungatella sp.]
MKYVKQSSIIFGITMAGELLYTLLPLPVPAGVYGLFLLLAGLCTGIIKLEHIEETGNFLLEIMPLMFIPVTVGLIENYDLMKAVAIPLIVISIVSTVIVMAVTGKITEVLIAVTGKKEKHHE